MSNINEKPLLGLIKGIHPIIYNREYNGVSNSLFDTKPIWNENSSLTYTANVNRSVSVVSTSSQDTTTGTGVKTIRISGLIHSLVNGLHQYNDQFVDVTMNGTNLVNVTGDFYRVLKIECIEFGSGFGMKNQGDIKVVIQGAGNFVLNCMKAGDNVSNSLIVSPPSGSSIILEKININAYFHTFSELEFRIIKTDGSIVKFQKIYVNSNTSYTTFPINKELKAGETFYIVMRNLEPIIGSNHISVMLESTNIYSDIVKTINKPYPEYGSYVP